MKSKSALAGAGILGFIAVAAGAFGAHALRDKVPPAMLGIFETASRYQLVHAAAILATIPLTAQFRSRLVPAASAFFLWGSVLFSGSLYLLVLSGAKAWGAVTPLGGLLLLAGWACLGLGAAKG
ncbi:MAG TPA: DUF423 domain-containing protein [Verrucomicrobiae bacterium]|jgi:uncharacterized membrane protein YgdD (TMEM256/DUF423 family)|nr:DUF423 domain-containing protein [Verrucomicrobiae bacterium]